MDEASNLSMSQQLRTTKFDLVLLLLFTCAFSNHGFFSHGQQNPPQQDIRDKGNRLGCDTTDIKTTLTDMSLYGVRVIISQLDSL
jgi:hypothetical protein